MFYIVTNIPHFPSMLGLLLLVALVTCITATIKINKLNKSFVSHTDEFYSKRDRYFKIFMSSYFLVLCSLILIASTVK